MRVIVRLRLPGGFRPEGRLPSPGAARAQRRAIASVQDEVLSKLGGARFTLRRRSVTTPFLTLEIQRDALRVLETLGGLVAEVRADAPVGPLGGKGPAPSHPSGK